MKSLPICVVVLYLTINGHVAAESPTYTTKYDGVNLDEILSNQRLLNGYIYCLLEKAPCTPDGKELKKNLPDAISNDCGKCSKRQQEGADQVMHYIIDHRPDDWKKLEEMYNSDGSYKMKYLKRKETSEGKEDTADENKEDSTEKSDE